MQMAKYSDNEILSSNLSLGICPGLNMWCLYELMEEKRLLVMMNSTRYLLMLSSSLLGSVLQASESFTCTGKESLSNISFFPGRSVEEFSPNWNLSMPKFKKEIQTQFDSKGVVFVHHRLLLFCSVEWTLQHLLSIVTATGISRSNRWERLGRCLAHRESKRKLQR